MSSSSSSNIKNRLDGKTVIVTGAGSGMGRAGAILMSRAGASVVVTDRDPQSGEETSQLIIGEGGKAARISSDVTNESDVIAMIAFAVERFGRIDCAFNNAGVPSSEKSIEAYSLNAFNRTIGVNLTGVFLCMKYQIEQMRRQGGPASIVNNASAWAIGGWANAAPYVASKAGVIGLTKSAALDLARSGIRINAVCPGLIRTPMSEGLFADPLLEAQAVEDQPMGRLGQPEEVGEAVLWLCSEASSFVTGAVLMVDGGWMV